MTYEDQDVLFADVVLAAAEAAGDVIDEDRERHAAAFLLLEHDPTLTTTQLPCAA